MNLLIADLCISRGKFILTICGSLFLVSSALPFRGSKALFNGLALQSLTMKHIPLTVDHGVLINYTIQTQHAAVWLTQGHRDVCFSKTSRLLNTALKVEWLFHLWFFWLTYSLASLKPRPQPILQNTAELHCLFMQRKIVLLKVTNYWIYSPFKWFLKFTFYICYGWNRPYSPGWSWTCGFPNLTS